MVCQSAVLGAKLGTAVVTVSVSYGKIDETMSMLLLVVECIASVLEAFCLNMTVGMSRCDQPIDPPPRTSDTIPMLA